MRRVIHREGVEYKKQWVLGDDATGSVAPWLPLPALHSGVSGLCMIFRA